MYHTGGVYLDLKCRILKPLDSWVHSEMLQLSTMPHWEHKQLDRAFPSSVRPKSNRREITQVALVFPKQHPLMRKVIDRMVEVIYAGGNKDILHVTGPHMMTFVIAPELPYIPHILHDQGLYNDSILYDGTDGAFHRSQREAGRYYRQLLDEDELRLLRPPSPHEV
ncbi:hypothetical protein CYMTET_14981 [Cymbomonas tetramitiformis]|uniref:Uncharacterized protein n=1 Tax=Cymbomonas tetramitiformis TaxID=36881 RepID=A0AAE0GF60_9CHLO|nr:hypothetical protein CYMTET_14981 [Cymbomonas tetramitiformis]